MQEEINMTFPTIQDRDRFLNYYFPDRIADEGLPGFYFGRKPGAPYVGVRTLEVTIYLPAPKK